MTATSVDGGCTKRWFVAVVGSGGGLGGVAEGVAEEVDGVALEAEPDVGVDGGGDADVGVAEEFLNDDEFDALFQEEGRRRVPKVMKPDASQGGPAEQGVEVPREGGSLDRGPVGPGEDVAARLPARPRHFAFLTLPVAVLFEGAQALGGQGDAPFRALGLGGQGGQAGGVGALEGAADAGGSAGQVEVFPAQAEEFALAEPGAQGEFEQRVQTVVVGGGEECAGLLGGEGFEAAGSGCAHADVAGHVAWDLLFADGVLQGGLEHGVDVGQRQRGQALGAALPDGTALRLVAGGVEAACAALAGGAELVEPGADVLGGELGELLLAEAGEEVDADDGGVAGVGVLAEPVDGDGLQPVGEERGEAALGGGAGMPRLLVAIFSVSWARASLRVVP